MIPPAETQATQQQPTETGRDGFYKNILENLSDGVYFVNLERKVTYWNKAAAEISGFAAQDVVGHACHDNLLVHTDADGCLLCVKGCPLTATFGSAKNQELQIFLRHRDGHRVPVFVHVSPMLDAEGKMAGAVEVFRKDSERLAALDRAMEMEQLALMDPLTSVGNRRYTEKTLAERAEAFRRDGEPYSMLFIDLDHFKSINHTYGHAAGDAVLQAVARTLEGNLRAFDFLGRWGGEEFVAILSTADAASATAVAQRC